MRLLKSFGLSIFILVVATIWFATGTLVQGGQGPGNGERSISELIDGKENGPLTRTLANAGLLVPHDEEEVELARMTVAQRVALENGDVNTAISVRTETFRVQQMPIEVKLRGRTTASANIAAVAQTPGVVQTLHVNKGDRVEAGDLLCTLDTGTRAAAVAQANAALAQAEAGLAQAQLDADTNASLRERGLAPANTANAVDVAVAAAEAAVSAAQAGLDNAQAELDRTRIIAEVGRL